MTTDPIAAARALLGRVPHLFIDKDGDLCRSGGGHNLVGCPAEDDEPPFGLLNPWVWRAIPELRDMVATLADAMETVTAIREKVEAERDQALARVAAVQWKTLQRVADIFTETKHMAEHILALPLDSDAQAALDKLLAEARAEGWRAGREAELDQKLERMLTKWESPAYQHVMLPGTHMTCDLAAPMIRAALRSTEASHDD